METKKKTIVIGGGPAGMMAAISSARSGHSVTLIEKNDTLGNKLLLTGNGRCNLTNRCNPSELIQHIATNGKFLIKAFKAFSNLDTIEFFHEIGLQTKTESNNRVYPLSDHSKDVAMALLREMKKAGVQFYQGEAKDIIVKDSVAIGVELKDGKNRLGDRIILATGGKSYPLTGSTGDGYRMARRIGHTIMPLRPALVPMEIHHHRKSNWMGLSIADAGLTLYNPQKEKQYTTINDLLFTHYGISGPAVLNTSSHCYENLEGYSIEIDLKPTLSEQDLDQELISRIRENPKRNIANIFYDLLPKRLLGDFLLDLGIPMDSISGDVPRELRSLLIHRIKHLTFPIVRLRSFREAMVTGGGVMVKEINPSTMESKLFQGLFFTGEVIDVDAYTGGFNLQIAFSTGFLAGKED